MHFRSEHVRNSMAWDDSTYQYGHKNSYLNTDFETYKLQRIHFGKHGETLNQKRKAEVKKNQNILQNNIDNKYVVVCPKC